MESNSSDMPVELSDAELATIHGGFLGKLVKIVKRNLIDPVIEHFTGSKNKEPEFNIYSPGPKPVKPVYTVDGQRLA